MVNDLKLVGPISFVKPWPHVESVVVAAFRIVEEGGRQDCGFMPVVGVVSEKPFDLHSQLLGVVLELLVDHPIEHGDRTQSFHLSQPAKHAELGIGKAHVFFVGLGDFSFPEGTKLGSGSGSEDVLYRLELVDDVEVVEYFLESQLGEGANGVDVGRAAVVLGAVTPQTLV